MTVELVHIPGVDPSHETVWEVRALVVDGRDPVRSALFRWRREYPDDYRAILKVMRLAAQQYRVLNPKHVKRSSNESFSEVYEMIAYTGIARMMFFYDESGPSLIVCSNEHEKGRGNQDAAFARCAALCELYRRRR